MANEDLSDVLSEFARTMLTDFPIQSILDHLVTRIVDVLPVTAAGVTLISPGADPRYIAASNGAALRFERLQTELGDGPCVAAYHTGVAVMAPDLASETRFAGFTPLAVEAGLAAVFAFPLRHEDAQLGALDLYRDVAGPLSDGSVRAAQTLADVAAAYLLNAQARSDLVASSTQSREAALHDPLTGLPNRVLMLERIEHAFLREQRSRKTSAVIFLDIDAFKEINDTHGHKVGDELLIATAERLSSVLRPGDTLSRLSGDEFVLLCEELDHHREADAVVARIATAMAMPFVLGDAEVAVSVSLGIAFSRGGHQQPAALLHAADLEMYRSKRTRSEIVRTIDPQDLLAADHHAELAEALPGAAERGELHLEYQPIVAAADGRITGVEALLRWTHPTLGLVMPTVLIPIAEHSGAILEIGQWVLEQAWTDRHRWQSTRVEQLMMSVNVSARQLMSPRFVESIADTLDPSTIDVSLLTLEVTESVFIRDADRAALVLGHLKEKGVKLALDDFGTGYSSLHHLLSYPVDVIKVDRAFVANLGADAANTTVMAAVIDLAHTLSMTVVSEGVETEQQHVALASLGCDACQGFYYARPMSATGIDELLTAVASGTRLPTHPVANGGAGVGPVMIAQAVRPGRT